MFKKFFCKSTMVQKLLYLWTVVPKFKLSAVLVFPLNSLQDSLWMES